MKTIVSKRQLEKILACFFLTGLFFGTQKAIAQYKTITEYQPYFATGTYHQKNVVILRKYHSDTNDFFIAVGLEDIKTYAIAANTITITPKSWADIVTSYKNTPYIKAIATAKKKSNPLQDAGIQHGDSHDKGINLTIDLCPSHKPLDRIIFSSLVTEFQKIERPVPVALSITGKFLNAHPDDIEWLKKMEENGALDIIWINHSYNHKYDPKLPLQSNFLLEAKTNLDQEIFQLEKTALERGLLCSVFFRFPGLVSDRSLVQKITEYGLIPIGSDAWLAKGQTARNGDIVLIHGNGNEPLGIKDFIELLQKERNAVLKKQWLLYDLRENVEEEFENK